MPKILLILIILIECVLASALFDHETFQRIKRQEPSCGVPDKLTASMIFNGDKFNRGAWPWMVALMSRDSTPPSFFCGATLITNNLVVTAAHCIHPKYRAKTNASDVLLIFGAYDLQEHSEMGSFPLTPKEFIVHPDWNPMGSGNDADVALIIPDDVIPHTRFIKPICLWESQVDPSVEGYTAGWGKDTSGNSGGIPMQLNITIHAGHKCDSSGSKRIICGGFRKDSGPCFGDSGSGVYVKHNKVFYLRAIVSATYVDEDGQCDVNELSLYANVLKFKEWIKATNLRQSCGEMSAATSMIQGGMLASREMFPWTVVVFDSEVAPEEQGHLTTGTLVSSRHVVSDAGFVAHFDSNGIKGIAHEVGRFKMYFGAFNLDSKNDADVIPASVSKIIVHPRYKKGKPYESDVAILVADRTIEFSQQISPICLWPHQDNSDDVEGKLGFSAGWGNDYTGRYTKSKQYIQLKMSTSCSEWQHRLSNVNYSKFFCANAVSVGAPCYGDEPLYLKSGDKWFLRGLRMSSFVTHNHSMCYLNKQILYEDLAFYSNWIQGYIDS